MPKMRSRVSSGEEKSTGLFAATTSIAKLLTPVAMGSR